MPDSDNNTMLRTLLLEDESLARWVARKSLEEAGAHVVDVETCADARAQIVCGDFDLFVLDFRLPDGTGKEVIEFIREKKNTRPVIVLSAETEEFPESVCRELSIHAVLGKPLDVETLQSTYRSVASSVSKPQTSDQTSPAPSSETSLSREKQPVWVDRFLLHELPEHISTQALSTVSQCCDSGNGWVALDLVRSNALDEDAVPVLVSLAAQCRSQGGRLALLDVSNELQAVLNEYHVDHEFDVVESTRALEALSRRLSSNCERLSLLDSIILPGEQQQTGGST